MVQRMRAFDVLKIFWDIVWVGYSLNEFITLKECSNDPWKNQTPKIIKNQKAYKECEESYSPFL